MRRSRRVLLVPLAILTGCESEEAAIVEEDDSASVPLAAIESNPCDATLTTRGLTDIDLDPPDTAIARLLTGTVDLANEAHDCQRLVLSTGASGEFGPLVGLFPV